MMMGLPVRREGPILPLQHVRTRDGRIIAKSCMRDIPCQMDGEVPRDNADGDSERSVSNNDLFLGIFLNDLLLQFDLRQLSEPVDSRLSLLNGKLDL